MLFKKLMAMNGYMNEQEGEGGAGGQGGDDEAAKAAAAEAAKAAKLAEEAKGGSGEADNKGTRKVSDEEARLLKENMKKKEALDKATRELQQSQETLKRFEGIDPDEVRRLLSEKKSSEEKQMEAKGEWDRLKTRMAEEHTKETAILQSQLEQLTAELSSTKRQVNELSIGTQFSQSKFISEELTLTPGKARVIYGDHFDLEDGKIVGYDKPRGASNRTAIVDQYGSAVPFEDALRKVIEADPEKDHLLKSKVRPGAGSDSKKPSGTQKSDTQLDGISKIAGGLKSIKF